MKRKLKTARTFRLADWQTLIQAWLLLLACDVGLRLLPFKQMQRLATLGRKEPAPSGSAAPDTIRRLHYLVEVAARNHLYTMSCLRQSLVLQWLLGRRGVSVDLRIGVSKEAGDLAAHAWLEYAGQPVGEPHSTTCFAPLQSAR